jgi:hypothetical protein
MLQKMLQIWKEKTHINRNLSHISHVFFPSLDNINSLHSLTQHAQSEHSGSYHSLTHVQHSQLHVIYMSKKCHKQYRLTTLSVKTDLNQSLCNNVSITLCLVIVKCTEYTSVVDLCFVSTSPKYMYLTSMSQVLQQF